MRKTKVGSNANPVGGTPAENKKTEIPESFLDPGAVSDTASAVVQTVVVCFGTPSISGDSFGPAVGSLLVSRYRTKAFVYGTNESPVNGKNMKEWMDFVKSAHRGAVVLAVDASLGSKEKVGRIMLRSDGVCPAAVKGSRRRFGDVGVLAVVGESKGDALMNLMQVSAVNVMKLAEKAAFMINSAVEGLNLKGLLSL